MAFVGFPFFRLRAPCLVTVWRSPMKKPFAAALALAIVLSSFLGSAQTYEGRIIGSITDPTGAGVAGAEVRISKHTTGVARNMSTNSAGDYVAPNLQPGTYSVSAEAVGFNKAENPRVIVEVGREARVDLQLHPGTVDETVEVTGQQTLVDLSDSTLNGVLENKAVNELPLQGRDFQNLLPLHPGVQRTPGGGFQSITSNGNRPDENNFFID